MSTPVYVHHSSRQSPMICEAMQDGTGRWRCTPEEAPMPTWLAVIFWIAILSVVGVIAKTLIGEWWEDRQWKKKRLEQRNRER